MEVLAAVEEHLAAALGAARARAAVTFLGAAPVEVLRFGPDRDEVVRYATLGMSAHPMLDPADPVPDATGGPRAELVLSLRPRGPAVALDTVVRRLAVLAMTPFVEGVVVAPGAGIDLGEALWEGAAFTAVLVGESGAPVADLALTDLALAGPGAVDQPVRFLSVLPMTPAEAAWKRVHGAGALRERWSRHGVDLLDPRRPAVRLGGALPAYGVDAVDGVEGGPG